MASRGERELEDSPLIASAVSEMASLAPASEDLVDGELDPELNTDFQVDPAFTTSKQFKEQYEAGKNEKSIGLHNLKSAFIISGVAVAMIGAFFALVKKIDERGITCIWPNFIITQTSRSVSFAS